MLSPGPEWIFCFEHDAYFTPDALWWSTVLVENIMPGSKHLVGFPKRPYLLYPRKK